MSLLHKNFTLQSLGKQHRYCCHHQKLHASIPPRTNKEWKLHKELVHFQIKLLGGYIRLVELRSHACFLPARKAGILGLTLMLGKQNLSCGTSPNIGSLFEIWGTDMSMTDICCAVDSVSKHKLNVYHGNLGKWIWQYHAGHAQSDTGAELGDQWDNYLVIGLILRW